MDPISKADNICYSSSYAYALLGFGLLLVWTFNRFMSQNAKLPPGPNRVPIFGNLFQLGPNLHRSLAALATKYGPVMGLKLGTLTVIVISSAKAFKEVQENDLAGHFSGRGNLDAATAIDHDKFSIIWLPNVPRWRTLRKIAATHLFSVASLDASRQLRRNVTVNMLSYIEKRAQEKSSVHIGEAAYNCILSLMSNAIFSIDLADPSSASEMEFKQVSRELMDVIGTANMVDYFPFLRALDPQGIRRRTGKLFSRIVGFFNGLIDDRLAGRSALPPDSDDDLLGILLNFSRDSTTGVTRDYIPHMIGDLFFAGIDAISVTVEYAMTELIRNPKKMRKLRQELADVIGISRGNPIEESDIQKLPYLQATLKETLRLHPPITVTFRETIRTFKVNGFVIPEGSRVWGNLWAIGRDPDVWPDPLLFEPERHVLHFHGFDFKGNTGSDTKVVAFGSGRRVCLGIPLVVRMAPVLLASLVHSFDWKLESSESLDMAEVFGLTVRKAIPLRAIPCKLYL